MRNFIYASDSKILGLWGFKPIYVDGRFYHLCSALHPCYILVRLIVRWIVSFESSMLQIIAVILKDSYLQLNTYIHFGSPVVFELYQQQDFELYLLLACKVAQGLDGCMLYPLVCFVWCIQAYLCFLLCCFWTEQYFWTCEEHSLRDAFTFYISKHFRNGSNTICIMLLFQCKERHAQISGEDERSVL